MATKNYAAVPEFVKSVHYMLGGPITLDPTADWLDEDGEVIEYAKKGTLLGKVTATGLAVPYDDTAANGSQTAIGILWEDISFESDTDKVAGVFMIHGRVDRNKLIGYDAAAASDLYGIAFEADDTGAVAIWSKVSGVLTDEDTDDPIDGALVSIELPDGSTVSKYTEADGSFEFERLPYGTLDYSISHPLYEDIEGEVEIGFNTVVELVLEAEKSEGSVSGTLVDEYDDTDIVGAVVKLMDGEDEVDDTTTNASGEFEFAKVEYGTYQIKITKAGYSDLVATVVVNDDIIVAYTGIRLTSTVSGVITNSDGGAAIAGALVTILQPDGTALTGVSDAEGAYEIEGAKYGSLTYWINKTGFDAETGTLTVDAATETLDKALTASL